MKELKKKFNIKSYDALISFFIHTIDEEKHPTPTFEAIMENNVPVITHKKPEFNLRRPHQVTHTHKSNYDANRRFKSGRPHHETHTHNSLRMGVETRNGFAFETTGSKTRDTARYVRNDE
jgi:hypothetical protein